MHVVSRQRSAIFLIHVPVSVVERLINQVTMCLWWIFYQTNKINHNGRNNNNNNNNNNNDDDDDRLRGACRVHSLTRHVHTHDGNNNDRLRGERAQERRDEEVCRRAQQGTSVRRRPPKNGQDDTHADGWMAVVHEWGMERVQRQDNTHTRMNGWMAVIHKKKDALRRAAAAASCIELNPA